MLNYEGKACWPLCCSMIAELQHIQYTLWLCCSVVRSVHILIFQLQEWWLIWQARCHTWRSVKKSSKILKIRRWVQLSVRDICATFPLSKFLFSTFLMSVHIYTYTQTPPVLSRCTIHCHDHHTCALDLSIVLGWKSLLAWIVWVSLMSLHTG